MKKLLFSLLLVSNLSHASLYNLQDFGSYTLDKNTGLEWLDTSYTIGKSYNQVLALTAAGQSLDGWRHATFDEVQDIFTTRGYSFSGTSKLTSSTTIINGDLFFLTLIDLLGATDTRSNRKDLLGLTAEDYKTNNEDSQLYAFMRSTYNTPNMSGYTTFSRYEDNLSASTLASLMVRNVSPVPTPESWVMMLTGLVFIWMTSRKMKA